MSHAASTWAVHQTAGSPGAKAVLMNLADRADENWSCYPGQALIAEETELSERSVRTHLAHLEAVGLLARARRRRADGTRTSDRYQLAAGQAARSAASASIPTQLPATVAATTGKSRQTYRQISPDLPATVAGQEEPPEEPPEEPHTPTPHDDAPIAAPAAPAESEQQLVLVEAQKPSTDLVTVATTAKTASAAEEFDTWWAAYPRKVGKGAARNGYLRARKSVEAQVLLDAVLAAAAGPWARTEARFIPHPATWLRAERWDDEHDPLEGMHPTDAATVRNLATLQQLREQENAEHDQDQHVDPWEIRA